MRRRLVLFALMLVLIGGSSTAARAQYRGDYYIVRDTLGLTAKALSSSDWCEACLLPGLVASS